MKDKNFKIAIRDRYKGRGNCWVKIPRELETYDEVLKTLTKFNASEYIENVEREGFAWVRFSKPGGTKDNPECIFEIRFRGSKIDHPDSTLTLDDKHAKELPFLGNTPVKLELEIHPKDRKAKSKSVVKRSRQKSKNVVEGHTCKEEANIIKQVEIIKEEVATKSSSNELREWERFLAAEDLLEFSI